MVEEGTLGLVQANESPGQLSQSVKDASKDELQHRMEVARESISHTVDEIKDTMVNQYESVKESVSKTLDWHEQVKKRPAAWSAGALGAGFVIGYGVAAVVKGPGKLSYGDGPVTPATVYAAAASQTNTGGAQRKEPEKSGPGLIEQIKGTPAYDRVKNEAGVIGNRLVEEISKKAQEVVLPAAIAWLGSRIEGLLPASKKPSISKAS